MTDPVQTRLQRKSMLMFSSLSLTGTHIPEAIHLYSTVEFPARQYDSMIGIYRTRKGWHARLPDKDVTRGQLSLELGERLGDGRTGVVYAARIVGTDPPVEEGAMVDSELCVKIGRPNRARSLAREAWMYRQLTEGWYQGVIAPRCYGFFTATLTPDQLPNDLWAGRPLEKDDPARDDHLPDDSPLCKFCELDSPGSREESVWVDWKPDLEAPLISVLVNARGGAMYTDNDDEDEDTQNDMLQIIDDLSAAQILHSDIRPVNIVQAPKNTQVCKRHKRVHKWNIVDFAYSKADGGKRDVQRIKKIRSRQRRDYQSTYFYYG